MSKFACSLARAAAFFNGLPYNGEKKVEIVFGESSHLCDKRTQLVSQAFQNEATHLLWLDSDMKFPPDTFNRLLNHNFPVVACNYAQKDLQAKPTAYVEDDEYVGPLWMDGDAIGVVQVKHAGMGVMLTDMRVYEAIDLPFFKFDPIPPDFVQQATEDVYFCNKLKAAGIPIYVDQELSLEVSHVGQFEYSADISMSAEKTRNEMREERQQKERLHGN